MLEDTPTGSPKWWLRRLDEERTRRAEVYDAIGSWWMTFTRP